MNELVKVSRKDSGEVAVNGRDLYEFLEVGSNYSTWMKRMFDYGFDTNVDFIEFWSDSKNGNAVEFVGSAQKMASLGYQVNHILKLDMAKEISMIQRTDKGKEARQYFIEVEKKYKETLAPSLPTTYKEALLALVEEVEKNEKLELENKVLDQKNKEYEPKATYYDEVLKAKGLITITKIAKDYGMTAIGMNNLLHELGVQYKQSGTWLLYAKYQDKGYTKTETHVVDGDNVKINTKWTQSGRLFIYDMLKEKGIKPLMEQGSSFGEEK